MSLYGGKSPQLLVNRHGLHVQYVWQYVEAWLLSGWGRVHQLVGYVKREWAKVAFSILEPRRCRPIFSYLDETCIQFGDNSNDAIMGKCDIQVLAWDNSLQIIS